MPRPKIERPSYCHHKPSGRAYVRIDRQTIYLGEYNSRESWREYHRLMAELPPPEQRRLVIDQNEKLSIAALVAKYDDHAQEYYQRDGKPTEERGRIKAAVRSLLELYAPEAVDEFTPLKLKAVRQRMIELGDIRRPKKCKHCTKQQQCEPCSRHKPLTRSTVNNLIGIIKRMFRWGVSEGLVPVEVYQALATVSGIRKWKEPKLKEPQKVKPVPEEHIPPVLRQLSPVVRAMVQVQMLTAMRPDEVTIMRPCDLETNTSDGIWVYRPRRHKLDWLEGDDEKQILIGPKAQSILEPFSERCAKPTDYVFPPNPRTRKPTDHYNDDTYCRAVKRACLRAGVPVWTPNRLRHNGGTLARKVHGAEAAQAMMGHRNLSTTEIYAERNEELYREVVRKIG